MNKLTDLEVNKLIAKIENQNGLTESSGWLWIDKLLFPDGFTVNNRQQHYSPATDGALCFKLMIKHKVILYPEYDNTYVAKIGVEIIAKSKSPYRAICLAIINHVGKGNE